DAKHRHGGVDLADLRLDDGHDLVILVDVRGDLQLDAVILPLDVGLPEAPGDRDRNAPTREKLGFPAAARAQLRRGQLPRHPVAIQDVDLGADARGDAEVALPGPDGCGQLVGDVDEGAAFRQDPVRGPREVLDVTTGRARDDVVLTNPQVAQRVAVALHRPHVHQHHRLHVHRVDAGEVDDVAVGLLDDVDAMDLVRTQLPGKHQLPPDLVDPDP